MASDSLLSQLVFIYAYQIKQGLYFKVLKNVQSHQTSKKAGNFILATQNLGLEWL